MATRIRDGYCNIIEISGWNIHVAFERALQLCRPAAQQLILRAFIMRIATFIIDLIPKIDKCFSLVRFLLAEISIQ